MNDGLRLGIVVTIVALSAAGCASARFENYAFADSREVFRTDMDGALDRIVIEGGVAHRDGALHHRAEAGRATGWIAEVDYGDRALVSFDLRLGEFVNEGHPDSHINLYTRFAPEYARYCIMISERGIGWFASDGGDFVDGSWVNSTTARHEWHHFDLLLDGDRVVVFRNGDRVRECRVPSDTVRRGALIFESHHEMWVDNVTVAEFGSFTVN